jgi:hypothetical protein
VTAVPSEADRLRSRLARVPDFRQNPAAEAVGNALAAYANGTAPGHQPVNLHATAGDSVAWPDPLPTEAYCGLAGEIVKAIGPQTESDPSAILLQVLTAFGALVGRGPHFRVEGDQHHSNIFCLLVGDTAKARKGTSWSRVRGLFERVEGWPNVVNGLSSGEGVKWAVRDGTDDEPGALDKRLLVVESEFTQVLKQAARAGNTLSPTLRCAYRHSWSFCLNTLRIGSASSGSPHHPTAAMNEPRTKITQTHHGTPTLYRTTRTAIHARNRNISASQRHTRCHSYWCVYGFKTCCCQHVCVPSGGNCGGWMG